MKVKNKKQKNNNQLLQFGVQMCGRVHRPNEEDANAGAMEMGTLHE